MIRAYHVIMTTYGFWLPNDPRGSWSDWVRQWELYAFGAATKVETRRSVAKQPHDRQMRMEAKKAEGLHPLAGFQQSNGTVPSPWARKNWPVFLESDRRILDAIGYVEKNLLRDGKSPQHWSFVTPFVPSCQY